MVKVRDILGFSFFQPPKGFNVSLTRDDNNWTLCRGVSSHSLRGANALLNGALYPQDNFENDKRPISVGFPFLEEVSNFNESDIPELFSPDDVYIRKVVPGINVIISRFDNKTLIRIQSPDNSFMDTEEKKLFFKMTINKNYVEIVNQIIRSFLPTKNLIKNFDTIKTAHVHFCLRVCAPDFDKSVTKNFVYLTDIINTCKPEDNVYYSTDELYKSAGELGFTLMPLLASHDAKNIVEVHNHIYQNGWAQCNIYFDDNQTRYKISNPNFVKQVPAQTMQNFTLHTLFEKLFHKKNFEDIDIQEFILQEGVLANALTIDSNRTKALDNIDLIRKNFIKLRKKIGIAKFYSVALLKERVSEQYSFKDCEPKDRSWIATTLNTETKDKNLKSYVWSFINKGPLPMHTIKSELITENP